jgi:hypothetical protein
MLFPASCGASDTMSAKIVFIIFLLCLLALIQMGFLARLDLIGNSWLRYFNIIIMFVVIFAFFERRKENASFTAAVFGGVLLDLYSENFFGFWVLILLTVVLLTKFVVRKYVRVPTFW